LKKSPKFITKNLRKSTAFLYSTKIDVSFSVVSGQWSVPAAACFSDKIYRILFVHKAGNWAGLCRARPATASTNVFDQIVARANLATSTADCLKHVFSCFSKTSSSFQ
jgi:hypothetical protein